MRILILLLGLGMFLVCCGMTLQQLLGRCFRIKKWV